MIDVVEVRFHKGENRRFSVPLKDDRGRRGGYPDVPTYLFFTGQVNCWCEEIPQKEFEEFNIAQKLRADIAFVNVLTPAWRV